MKLDKRVVAVYNLYKQGGSEHEKDVALKLLEKICKKAGFTVKDVEDAMTYNGEEEKFWTIQLKHRQILVQVVYKVTGRTGTIRSVPEGKRLHVGVMCTQSEQDSIMEMFDYYAKIYTKEFNAFIKEQKDAFTSAFIQKHKIFGEGSEEKDDGESPDLDNIAEMMRIMGLLDDSEFIPNSKKLK